MLFSSTVFSKYWPEVKRFAIKDQLIEIDKEAHKAN